MKFSEMGLKKEIVDSLSEEGLVDTFQMQESTMPHILNGEDVIGQAHTGSGKTLAFSLPIIQKLDHLTEILRAIKGKILIFCSTKLRTRMFSRDLYRNEFRTVEIHGDLS